MKSVKLPELKNTVSTKIRCFHCKKHIGYISIEVEENYRIGEIKDVNSIVYGADKAVIKIFCSGCKKFVDKV